MLPARPKSFGTSGSATGPSVLPVRSRSAPSRPAAGRAPERGPGRAPARPTERQTIRSRSRRQGPVARSSSRDDGDRRWPVKRAPNRGPQSRGRLRTGVSCFVSFFSMSGYEVHSGEETYHLPPAVRGRRGQTGRKVGGPPRVPPHGEHSRPCERVDANRWVTKSRGVPTRFAHRNKRNRTSRTSDPVFQARASWQQN